MGDDPELAVGMADDGDGLAGRGADGPTPSEKVDLVIEVAATPEMKGQVEIQEAGVGTGAHGIASIAHGFCPSVVGGKARGAADGSILAVDLGIEDFLGLGVEFGRGTPG